jgi:hypothetical protein
LIFGRHVGSVPRLDRLLKHALRISFSPQDTKNTKNEKRKQADIEDFRKTLCKGFFANQQLF